MLACSCCLFLLGLGETKLESNISSVVSFESLCCLTQLLLSSDQYSSIVTQTMNVAYLSVSYEHSYTSDLLAGHADASLN